MNGLFHAIRAKAELSRRRVAIGVVRPPTAELIAGFKEAVRFADITVVGTPIEGFEAIPAMGDRVASDRLTSLVQNEQVDAIVRGQVYYTDYHESMNQNFGFRRDVMGPCLLRDICGNEWFIAPVVHDDDDSVDGRCYLASQAARICDRLGVEPIIGVLAPDNERGYKQEVDEGWDEAEAVVNRLQTCGLSARLFPLRIDSAASECNIVVPMDGILGNFICRSLAYLGGATLVGGFTLTRLFVSLDTSRSNDRFAAAIESAVAMVNVGGMPVEEFIALP